MVMAEEEVVNSSLSQVVGVPEKCHFFLSKDLVDVKQSVAIFHWELSLKKHHHTILQLHHHTLAQTQNHYS